MALLTPSASPHDADIGVRLQQRFDPLSYDLVVVDDQDADLLGPPRFRITARVPIAALLCPGCHQT